MSNSDTVLSILKSHGSMTSKDLVERTGLSKRAVSVAVGRLVKDGHAVRGADGAMRATSK